MFINFPFLIRKKKKIQKEKENLKNSKKNEERISRRYSHIEKEIDEEGAPIRGGE